MDGPGLRIIFRVVREVAPDSDIECNFARMLFCSIHVCEISFLAIFNARKRKIYQKISIAIFSENDTDFVICYVNDLIYNIVVNAF